MRSAFGIEHEPIEKVFMGGAKRVSRVVTHAQDPAVQSATKAKVEAGAAKRTNPVPGVPSPPTLKGDNPAGAVPKKDWSFKGIKTRTSDYTKANPFKALGAAGGAGAAAGVAGSQYSSSRNRY